MAKFTNAAKVLGGEMWHLARPNLANLALTGAGAITAGASAKNMNDKGIGVGNSIGAAAGTAAMALGGHRLGMGSLGTSLGQKNLAKGIINSAERLQKGDASLHPLAKQMGKMGGKLNKSATASMKNEALAARANSLDARMDAVVGKKSTKPTKSKGFWARNMGSKANKLTVEERRAALAHSNAVTRRSVQRPGIGEHSLLKDKPPMMGPNRPVSGNMNATHLIEPKKPVGLIGSYTGNLKFGDGFMMG